MANGNGGYAPDLKNAPWWVQAAVTFGASTVAAGFLLWFVVARVDRDYLETQRAMRVELAATKALIETHVEDARKNYARHNLLLEANGRVLVATCINAARDENGRNRCLGLAVDR